MTATELTESFRIDSKRGRRWLTHRFREIIGRPPNKDELSVIVNALEATAWKGPKYEVAVRVAGDLDATYFALHDGAGTVIQISDGAWRPMGIARDTLNLPFRFVAPEGCSPVPMPSEEEGCSLEKDYVDLFNLESEAQRRLLIVSAVQKLDPLGPYVIDNFVGEQGAAKSTASRLHRCLTDPNESPLRRSPRSERDLMIATQNAHILVFENMSELKPWLSDALCSLSTGSGFSTRALYTDDGEQIFKAKRPVILNGIPALTERGDFADRSILFRLPAITDEMRLTEKAFNARWEKSHPRALRALLDLTARAQQLRVQEKVKLDSHPRMADFAELGVAVEMASREGVGGLTPWPEGSFMEAYIANRMHTQGMTLESGFGSILVDLLTSNLLTEKQIVRQSRSLSPEYWEIEVKTLLKEIHSLAKDVFTFVPAKNLPSTAKGVRSILDRLAPALRMNGVALEFSKDNVTRRSVVIFKGQIGGTSVSIEDEVEIST